MEKKELLKEKILSAAKEIVENEGERSLTVYNICRRCRVSRRAFYKAFPSKNDLIQCLEKKIDNSAFNKADIEGVIVSKAIDLFSKSSLNEVNMKKIADAVGVTRITLYRHFNNKIGLFECCVKYKVKEFKKSVADILYNSDNPVDSLQNYIEQYFKYVEDSSCRALVIESINLIRVNKNIKKSLDELHEYIIKGLTRLLDECKRLGYLEEDINSVVIAKLIKIIQDGVILYYTIYTDTESLQHIKTNMLKILFSYIKKG